MYVVSVIPIQRGIPVDTLTYFSSDPIPEGFLVKVPLQHKEVPAIALKCQLLTDAKLDVKKASFTLRKISQLLGPSSFDHTFLRAAETAARFSFLPLGAFFGELLASGAIEARQYLLRREKITRPVKKNIFVQKDAPGRTLHYKHLIRTALAEGDTVVFIVPTTSALETWKKRLSRGIERRSVVFHSALPKSELKRSYRNLFESKKGMFIMATPHFAAIPWIDPGLIIIENPSHVGFESRGRFSIDYRHFFLALAKERGRSVVFGDSIIPFRYLWEEEVVARTLFPRSYFPENLHVLDVAKATFDVLPQEIIELCFHVASAKKRLFIYNHRKGVAPYAFCGACRSLLSCPACHGPLGLKYIKRDGAVSDRIFLCTACGHREPGEYPCQRCGSWDIALGEVGTEVVAERIRELHLPVDLFVVDSDQEETLKDTMSAINASKQGAIIIGTDRMIEETPKIDFSVVLSTDRMLSNTALSAGERLLRLIYTLSEHSREVVVVTRHGTLSFIEALEKRSLARYIEDQSTAARTLGYPPFGHLIKLRVTLLERDMEEAPARIQSLCAPLELFHVGTRREHHLSGKRTLVFLAKVGANFFDPEHEGYHRLLEAVATIPWQVELSTDEEYFF